MFYLSELSQSNLLKKCPLCNQFKNQVEFGLERKNLNSKSIWTHNKNNLKGMIYVKSERQTNLGNMPVPKDNGNGD